MPLPDTQDFYRPILEALRDEAPHNLAVNDLMNIAEKYFELGEMSTIDRKIFRQRISSAKKELKLKEFLTNPTDNMYIITSAGLNYLDGNDESETSEPETHEEIPEVIEESEPADVIQEAEPEPEDESEDEDSESEPDEEEPDIETEEAEPEIEPEIVPEAENIPEPEIEPVPEIEPEPEIEPVSEDESELESKPEEEIEEITEVQEDTGDIQLEDEPEEFQQEEPQDESPDEDIMTEEEPNPLPEESEPESEVPESLPEELEPEPEAGHEEDAEPALEPEAQESNEDDMSEMNNTNENNSAGIEDAIRVHNEELAEKVLSEMSELPPEMFEVFVIDLLSKMGYRAFHNARYTSDEAGNHLIHGVIIDDKTGAPIYIHARKSSSDKTIGRADMQDFIDALSDKGGKGIFATTANFSEQAEVLANDERIMLIDGMKLAGLMIAHDFCVKVEKVYEIKGLDTESFSEYKR